MGSTTPSVAGLILAVVPLLVFAVVVPYLIRRRRALATVAAESALSRQARLITSPVRIGGARRANVISEPVAAARVALRAGVVSAPVAATKCQSQPNTPEAIMDLDTAAPASTDPGAPVAPAAVLKRRANYLAVRRSRARRRLVLVVALSLVTLLMWMDFMWLAHGVFWWHAVIPTALLGATLVLGRLAAMAATKADQEFAAKYGAPSSSRATRAGLAADHDGYSEVEPDAAPADSPPIAGSVTELMPAAERRAAVAAAMRDDSTNEIRWALAGPALRPAS